MKLRSALIAAGMALAASPALAHHSAAMYDMSKLDTLTGTVRAFYWTNPHVNVDFVADAEGGQPPQEWTLEASSPGVLVRSGWSKRSLNPGDKVKVQFHPLRDGGLGGDIRTVVTADGKTLTWSPSALPTQ
jgi:hypothetical protein